MDSEMYLLEVYYDSKTLLSLIVSFHSCSLTSTSNNPLYNKHFISTFSLVPLKSPKQIHIAGLVRGNIKRMQRLLV